MKRMTNFTPTAPRWHHVDVTAPPVGKVLLISDGGPSDNYPVTAFSGPDGIWLRTDGTKYGDDNIVYWMERDQIQPPPPVWGEYQFEDLDETARFFDAMRGLKPTSDWDPATCTKVGKKRTGALQHLATDYRIEGNSWGAKHLGFKPVKPIVIVYVWNPEQDWPRENGRPDVGFTVDHLVVCESPDGLPECLGAKEVLGDTEEHRPTQDEIKAGCDATPKDWSRQQRRQDILTNGRVAPSHPLTGDLFDELEEELF